MLEKRREFIDRLLNDLKLLEERLLSVKESDTLPFSFFRASFSSIEDISRSLHELELMQIEEMKEQMNRLVKLLSEKESQVELLEADSGVEALDEVVVEKEQIQITEKFVLPGYRDPRINVDSCPPFPAPEIISSEVKEPAQSPSLNDVVKAPPTLLDLKREISLNDRFLFQRELFHNNREEMNRVMETLNSMESYEAAEDYLRRECDLNLENQTAKDFLLIVKKGFK